jgi:hypothetical protein
VRAHFKDAIDEKSIDIGIIDIYNIDKKIANKCHSSKYVLVLKWRAEKIDKFFT